MFYIKTQNDKNMLKTFVSSSSVIESLWRHLTLHNPKTILLTN